MRARSSILPISAPGVHPIDWECVDTHYTVKKLDSPGMKYTKWIVGLFTVCLATFLGTSRVQAQSGYVSGAPTYNGASAITTTGSPDEPQSLVTLHARVNEVNVLFIATDKHG